VSHSHSGSHLDVIYDMEMGIAEVELRAAANWAAAAA
jgi:hypothetical protein